MQSFILPLYNVMYHAKYTGWRMLRIQEFLGWVRGMITKEQAGKIKKMVQDILDEKFNDQFVFDPIIVKNAFDYYDGTEYIRIYIVYDGDRELLDPGWTAGFACLLIPKLKALGIDDFPVKSFVDRAGWDAIQKGQYFEKDSFSQGYRYIDESEASAEAGQAFG